MADLAASGTAQGQTIANTPRWRLYLQSRRLLSSVTAAAMAAETMPAEAATAAHTATTRKSVTGEAMAKSAAPPIAIATAPAVTPKATIPFAPAADAIAAPATDQAIVPTSIAEAVATAIGWAVPRAHGTGRGTQNGQQQKDRRLHQHEPPGAITPRTFEKYPIRPGVMGHIRS